MQLKPGKPSEDIELAAPARRITNKRGVFLVSRREEHGVALQKTAQHDGITPNNLSGRVGIAVLLAIWPTTS